MKSMKKGTILVVDDSRVSQTHLVQILQDEYIVHAASSGVEAIQVAKAARPDLILLDVVMPQMDGYETITALRESEKTKHIPVIFITSLDQGSDEEKGLMLGAVDYIVKPYNPTIVKLRISIQLKIVEQLRLINELSMMDAVTRLPNRRYFDRRLSEEWQRAVNEKSKRNLGILMIDIDKLRAFNAIYGYANGDICLAAVAEIVSENAILSPGDIAARWAFGSFTVLMLNANAVECRTIGENIRQAVQNTPVTVVNEENAFVTVSIGAISVSPDTDDCSVEQFISNADSALYLAKELGRNQVVVHS